MDGNYLIKAEFYKKYLINWITKTINNNSWDKYEDLHIDEINDEFKSDNNWIEGSIYLFKIINQLINNTPYTSYLVIQLNYSENETNPNMFNLDYIKEQIYITPPSFYLFPKGKFEYEKTLANLQFVECLSKEINFKVYLKENRESDNEYFRCLFITI